MKNQVGEVAEVKTDLKPSQVADIFGSPQNTLQEKYLLTVANLLGVQKFEVVELLKNEGITMEKAEEIHRGAQVLDWKAFKEHFAMDPHPNAVAYWMATHVVNKRNKVLVQQMAMLKQGMNELARRVLALEQKQK
jgi:hypothetical protein